MGLFSPIDSKQLKARIPAHLISPGNQWFGFSTRARVIVYNKTLLDASNIQNYEDLANPRLKGKVCVRSGGHVYNLSLMSALIEHWGEARAEEWARGVVANFARAPKGGDTDQITAVASGECGVAIANTYYYARLLASEKPGDRKLMANVAMVWPNQKTTGTHLNISGAGVLKTAPNKAAAIQYLEYLASDAAPIKPPLRNSSNRTPKAVATIERSRSMAPPIKPTPAKMGISASPRCPPVTVPPMNANAKPIMMAMAHNARWPAEFERPSARPMA